MAIRDFVAFAVVEHRVLPMTAEVLGEHIGGSGAIALVPPPDFAEPWQLGSHDMWLLRHISRGKFLTYPFHCLVSYHRAPFRFRSAPILVIWIPMLSLMSLGEVLGRFLERE